MTNAAITGWGKCMPPSVLSHADLATFLYSLSTATAMIRTGVVKNAVVVGVELISPFMDWANRGVAVLFGDGAAAVVLQATDRQEGVLAEKLGCYADARQILRVRGMG